MTEVDPTRLLSILELIGLEQKMLLTICTTSNTNQLLFLLDITVAHRMHDCANVPSFLLLGWKRLISFPY